MATNEVKFHPLFFITPTWQGPSTTTTSLLSRRRAADHFPTLSKRQINSKVNATQSSQRACLLLTFQIDGDRSRRLTEHQTSTCHRFIDYRSIDWPLAVRWLSGWSWQHEFDSHFALG
ncbi:uncharacterized protein LOC144196251 [Stigmatopora nigra]